MGSTIYIDLVAAAYVGYQIFFIDVLPYPPKLTLALFKNFHLVCLRPYRIILELFLDPTRGMYGKSQ